MALALPIDPSALTLLEESALARLLGMLLDQQITMEKAFSSPYVLTQRLGHQPTATELAEFDPEELLAIFAKPPVLHRFPKVFAARTQDMCRVLVDRYGDDVARLWSEAKSGTALLARVRELPGFGEQKAKIFVALLGKQYGVQPRGWRQAAGVYGDKKFRSVADVVDADALAKVREYKKAVKAEARAGGD